MASKTVSTRLYEMSHGAQPRGHGLWMFATVAAVRAARRTGELPEDMVQVTGTYTQAKAQLAAGEWVVMP